MEVSTDYPLPIEAWSADMNVAIRCISELGNDILVADCVDNAPATAIAKEWRISERLND